MGIRRYIDDPTTFRNDLEISQGIFTLGPAGRDLKNWWNFEDFIGSSYSPTSLMRGIWMPISAGTGARASDKIGTALRPGILTLTTGTDTTGSAAIIIGSDSLQHFLFGGGVYTIEADIFITDLSTVTETYAFRLGFGDSSSADFVDGAYFEYTNTGSTPNWYKCTANNSTRTKTNTGIAVVAGAWTRLKIVVNADGTSVEYFINGVSAGVVITNIPTAAGRETTAVCSIIKSAGTTARLINIDWTWIHIDLATSR